jgi:hypothetical protein
MHVGGDGGEVPVTQGGDGGLALAGNKEPWTTMTPPPTPPHNEFTTRGGPSNAWGALGPTSQFFLSIRPTSPILKLK